MGRVGAPTSLQGGLYPPGFPVVGAVPPVVPELVLALHQALGRQCVTCSAYSNITKNNQNLWAHMLASIGEWSVSLGASTKPHCQIKTVIYAGYLRFSASLAEAYQENTLDILALIRDLKEDGND